MDLNSSQSSFSVPGTSSPDMAAAILQLGRTSLQAAYIFSVGLQACMCI